MKLEASARVYFVQEDSLDKIGRAIAVGCG
jgi:hypothetical protein